MVESGRRRAYTVLRSSGEPICLGQLSFRGGCVLAPGASTPEPKRARALGTNEATDQALATSGPHSPSLSLITFARQDLGLVRTRGKSRMQEICPSGSVRGVRSNPYPYRDTS